MENKRRLEQEFLASVYMLGADGLQFLRRVPLKYFSERNRRIAERLLEGRALPAGDILLLEDVASREVLDHPESYVHTLYLEGYMDEVERFANSLKKAASFRNEFEVEMLLSNPPLQESLEDEEYAVGSVLEQLGGGPEYTIPVPGTLPTFATYWGPMMPGGVYVVAAPEGVGKSALAEQFALEVAMSGMPVVDFTLELAPEVRVLRYMQHLYGPSVGPMAYYSRKGWNPEEAEKARKHLAELPLFVVSGVDSVNRMLAVADKFVSKGAKLFIVDFIQSIASDDGSTDLYSVITNAMKQIFRFARDRQVVFMVLSQMNREGVRRATQPDKEGRTFPPDNTAIEGSSKIPQYAWVVTFVLPQSNSSRKVWVTKNRTGGLTGEFEVAYNGEYLTFSG